MGGFSAGCVIRGWDVSRGMGGLSSGWIAGNGLEVNRF